MLGILEFTVDNISRKRMLGILEFVVRKSQVDGSKNSGVINKYSLLSWINQYLHSKWFGIEFDNNHIAMPLK